MGTEDWILKGTKFITNTKKKIKNLEQKLDSQKYNIFLIAKIIKYIYMKFALKIGFFCKVIVDFKNEN